MPIYRADNKEHLNKMWPRISRDINKCDSEGKKFELVIRLQSKSRDQERKYHAMIKDIAGAGRISYGAVIIDFTQYSADRLMVAKALLITWYEHDLKSQGEGLSKPSAWVIDPITAAPITVRASSKEFTVKEASGFIEFLYSVGAENKIAWSDPETRAYEVQVK